MSHKTEGNGLELSSQDQQSIDSICDEFEQACKSGEHPQLGDYVGRLKEPLATPALVELVILDAFYNRPQASEHALQKTVVTSKTSRIGTEGQDNNQMLSARVSWNEYTRRFPQLAGIEMPNEFRTSSNSGNSIGDRFQNIRRVASGGLGKVSAADDLQFGRTVAVKEMHDRLAGKEDHRRRFLREAEITGQLEHPGIVPVYVMGQHSNGHPYYVMRLVQGQSLLDAIDRIPNQSERGGLSIERRKLLNRFVQVCQAVEFAHSRDVIHRDIKPENIMLGGYGETFLVDWGLAKKLHETPLPVPSSSSEAVDSGTTDASQTHLGTVMGTPAYMSPEQSTGDSNRVNQASDVYSLGATLFHILTGKAPVQAAEQTRDFVQPSSANAVGKQVPDALMAICRKAMAPNPERRYSSAAQLASDVELALADQPVSVYPDPVSTRVRRWIQQHLALTAASLVATGLVAIGGIVFSGMSGEFANELLSRNQQLDQKIVLEKQLREESQKSEQRTRDAMKYLVNAMRSPDPNRDGRDIRMVEVLEQAVEQLAQDLGHEPLLNAQMLLAFGRTYLGLGKYEEAKPMVENAYAIFRTELGEANRITLNAGDQLAENLYMLGDPAAEELISSIVETSRSQYGDSDADTLRFRHTAAEQMRISGKAQQAVDELREVLSEYETLYGSDAEETLNLMNNLAVACSDAGLDADAVRMSRLVYEKRLDKNGPEATSTISSGSNYAVHLGNTTDRQLATPLHEQFLTAARKKWGNEHHRTLVYINRLGTSLIADNKLDRAMPLLQELHETSHKVYGATHTVTLNAANTLAIAFLNAGDYDNAAKRFKQLYDLSVEINGAEHKRTLTYANNLGAAYRNLNNLDGAIEILKSTLIVQQKQLGPEHPDTLRSMLNLASTMQQAGYYRESIPVCREACRLASDNYGEDHGHAQTALSLEAMAHLHLKNYLSAQLILKSSLESRTRTIPDHWLRYNTMSLLGEAQMGLGEWDQAESLLLESYRNLQGQKDKIPQPAQNRIEQARQRLISLYEAKNMPEAADRYRRPD